MNHLIAVIITEEVANLVRVLPSDESQIRRAIVGNTTANAFTFLAQYVHDIAALELALYFGDSRGEQTPIVLLEGRGSTFVHCDLALGSQPAEHPSLSTLHLIHLRRKKSAYIFSLANLHQYVGFSPAGNYYVYSGTGG
jgi:hypothetical protein